MNADQAPAPSCPSSSEINAFLAMDASFSRQSHLFGHIENCPHCLAYIAAQAGDPLNLNSAAHRDLSEMAGLNAAGQSSPGLIPSHLGDYQVLRPLGQGGMGVVYEGLDTVLNRPVALKVLNLNKLSTETIERIEREAIVQSRLSHPNIVPIYEFRKSGNRPFIVMELVQGQTLSQTLQHKPVSPRKAALILARLARTIGYAHRMGVVHRDLKPSNVLVTGELTENEPADSWSLKIIDFGLSKWLEGDDQRITLSTSIVGTPAYLAPELTRSGAGNVGPSVDIYALGVILYECLVGRLPFVAENALQTMDLIRNLEPVAPAVLQPALPRDLNTICLKCLEKDPARRYLTALELAEELDRYLGGFPIKARPLGPLALGLRWCGRNRSLAKALTAAAALLMIVIFGSIYFGYSQAQLRREAEQSDREKQQALNVISRQSELASNYAYFWLRLINRIEPESQGHPVSVLNFLDKAAAELNKDQLQSAEGKSTYQIALANAYLRLGEADRSEALLKNVEETLKTILRMDNAPSYEIREALANAYLLRNRFDQACSLLLQVAQSRMEADRLLRISGLKCMEQLADAALKANRPTEAIPLLKRALQLQQENPNLAKLNMAGIRGQLEKLYRATGSQNKIQN